jgi:hypothetical protein
LTLPRWKKSSYSGNETACVEFAWDAVRDSKHRAGDVLAFDRSAVDAFLASVKSGRFDR